MIKNKRSTIRQSSVKKKDPIRSDEWVVALKMDIINLPLEHARLNRKHRNLFKPLIALPNGTR